MSNLSNRLEEWKAPQKDVSICLDPELLEAREAVLRSTPRRQDVQDDRMVTPAPSEEDQQRLAEVERQIQDASITLRIHGVDRVTYNKWLLACPPRKGVDAVGFNPTTFYMHAAKNSAVYVDEDGAEHEISPEEWTTIDKRLSDGEYDRIAKAVTHVNRAVGLVDVSFFGNASEMTRDSFGISASRETSGSPRVASGAGNRKKSTLKTQTAKGDASSE